MGNRENGLEEYDANIRIQYWVRNEIITRSKGLAVEEGEDRQRIRFVVDRCGAWVFGCLQGSGTPLLERAVQCSAEGQFRQTQLSSGASALHKPASNSNRRTNENVRMQQITSQSLPRG